jgi:hypothetical protein
MYVVASSNFEEQRCRFCTRYLQAIAKKARLRLFLRSDFFSSDDTESTSIMPEASIVPCKESQSRVVPSPFDLLLGRGKSNMKHRGNVLLRGEFILRICSCSAN